MTCIVGVKTKTGVLLAGDALGSAGYDCAVRRDRKVHRLRKDVAAGFCGSYRMAQIIAFHMRGNLLPTLPAKMDPFEWSVTQFVPLLRQQLHRHGHTIKEDNQESIEGSFLLAVRDRLFQIEADFQVGEAATDYDSVGCGYPYALGALSALHGTNIAPRTMLTKALNTAAYWSNGVRGPYTFVEVKA